MNSRNGHLGKLDYFLSATKMFVAQFQSLSIVLDIDSHLSTLHIRLKTRDIIFEIIISHLQSLSIAPLLG